HRDPEQRLTEMPRPYPLPAAVDRERPRLRQEIGCERQRRPDRWPGEREHRLQRIEMAQCRLGPNVLGAEQRQQFTVVLTLPVFIEKRARRLESLAYRRIPACG